MRYTTVVLKPGREGFAPGYRALADESTVTRECIHHINKLDDGTIVMLYRLRGDLTRAKEALDTASNVITYDVAGSETGLVYLHVEAVDPAKSLLSILQSVEIVLDTPLEFTIEGDLRVTVIGEATALQQAFAAASDLVPIHLEEAGEYRPDLREVNSMLTDRQYEILTVAVENGYYEIPRGTTIREIAEEVGLGRSTVGEHIQKIETRILSRVVY